MPLGTFDLAAADEALLEDVQPYVMNALTTSSALLQLITRRKKTIGGRYMRELVRTGRNPSPQFRPSTGTMPPAGHQAYSEFRETVRSFFGGIALADEVLESMKDDSESFISAVDSEVDGVIEDAKNVINKFGYLDGSGIIAEVVSVAGTTINCRGPGTRYMRQLVGAYVGFYDGAIARDALGAADLRANTGPRQIAGITDNDTFTVDAAPAADVVQGDFICFVGPELGPGDTSATSAGQAMLGLLALVDDGTFRTTLHNITHATEAWNSTVIRGAGTPPAAIELDEGAGAGDDSERLEYLGQLVDDCQDRGNAYPDVILTEYAGKRRYQHMLDPDIRFRPLQLKGGYEVLTFAGGGVPIPFVVDRDCVHGMDSNASTNNAVTGRLLRTFYFALKLDAFAVIQTRPMHFRDDDGSILARDPNRKPFYTADLVWRFNFINEEPHKSGMLADVAVRRLRQ